ncbi:MAG: hypothetical protein K8R87_08725 [Verrucomicrobia bacterium]|nr:hypothetical protein [Verrucomicrobiota bacterium]
MKMPRLVLSIALILFLAPGLSQCGKKDAPATPGTSNPTADATTKPPVGLTAQAAMLGFAGKLPATTELYVGSANFKQHLDTLKKTAFYKEISALANDKTPAPASGDKSMKALQKLWGDEFFIAGAAGTTEFATWLRSFNRLYNELNFRMLMTGAALSPSVTKSEDKSSGFNPAVILKSLLADPTQLDRASEIIAKFDLPPVLIGFKVENPAEVARDLIPEEVLKKIPADKITVGTFKSPDGSTFQTLTTEGGKLLADELKQQMLTSLPPIFNDQSRKTIEKILTDFQSKKFALAWGPVGDHLIFAIGKNLDHLNFTADAATSILSKPELAQLSPYANKNLLGLAYTSASVLSGMMDNQPLTPMIRGVVGAMKDNPMFSNLGKVLDAQLTDYTPAESALFKMEITAQTAAISWDRGLHMESFGGARSKAFELSKNLQYARLIDQPGVVAGFAYQRSQPFEKFQREWMEKLFGMFYTSVQELMKSGIAGPEGGQGFAMFEGLALPMLKKLYEADRELTDKGLGGEAAFVLDVNGKMPSLPGIPIEAKDMKFPRITSISEVINREVVAASWKKMSDTITEAAGIVAGMSGAGAPADKGNAPGSAPAGFALPDPISSEKNGVTTWFYAFPYFAGDMLPCASINNKLLVLSSSKDCAESIAGELAKPATTSVDGLVWKLDLGALVDWGISAAKLSPKQSPDDQKEMKQVQKWAKPFHAMRGRVYMENSVPRQSFSWEITDLVSFD